jgi:hypothetical protein
MALVIAPWRQDTADLLREEKKREASPASFFFSQGQALVLSAEYFTDARLTHGARGGVAKKHRHRIQLALYGQLLASLEYLLKDFIARVIDLVPTFDERVRTAKWISLDADRVLSSRLAPSSAGAMLLHTTLGWHEPETVNERYKLLFQKEPIEGSEIAFLKHLWIIRHSVAHNAGFVAQHDAVRSGLPNLSGKVADLQPEHLKETFEFLCRIAKRIAEVVGDRIVLDWLKSRVPQGKDYGRDKGIYKPLKLLATYVASRAEDLPPITKGAYSRDFGRAERA